MHKRYTDIRVRLMALFLTILFTGYVSNNIFFTHVHFIDDVAIVHAHPFGGAHHTHSGNTATAISFLNHFLSIAAISTIAICTHRLLIHVVIILSDAINCAKPSIHTSLRAPPILS